MPDVYEASARIYVDTQSVLKPLMQGLAVQPNVDQQVMILSRTLISRPNIEKLVRMADLDLSVKSKAEQDAMIDELMKALKIESLGRDNLYTLSYRDAKPEQGQARRAVADVDLRRIEPRATSARIPIRRRNSSTSRSRSTRRSSRRPRIASRNSRSATCRRTKPWARTISRG